MVHFSVSNKTGFRLDEIVLMRCVLALLIVFMHAFTCYNGSWHEPAGYIDIPLYKWLTRWSFAFTLEAFVFISGYLLAFQRITLKRAGGIRFIVNKVKRLILPNVIFSLAYFVIFFQYKGVGNMVYSTINGCGHLWFLPMLFWCFVLELIVEQINCKDKWKLVFLVVINLVAVITLPLRLTSAATFGIYFYGGYVVYKYREFFKRIISSKRLIKGWILFMLVFIVFRLLQDVLVDSNNASFLSKMLMILGSNVCQLIYASIGCMIFYLTALSYTMNHRLHFIIYRFAACCFGIFIFQQFILQLLYYKTQLPTLVGPYWLPWVGFFVAALLSYLLTEILLKTKSGKYLIG